MTNAHSIANLLAKAAELDANPIAVRLITIYTLFIFYGNTKK
jgi:hypothetical protein